MNVVLLVDDMGGRFKKDEVGELLENDFEEKYDFKVRLDGIEIIKFGGKDITTHREFYFYKHEIGYIK